MPGENHEQQQQQEQQQPQYSTDGRDASAPSFTFLEHVEDVHQMKLEEEQTRKQWNRILQLVKQNNVAQLQCELAGDPSALLLTDEATGNSAVHEAILLNHVQVIKLYQRLTEQSKVLVRQAPRETRFVPTPIQLEHEPKMFFQNVGVQAQCEKFSFEEIRWEMYNELENQPSNVFYLQNKGHFTPFQLAIHCNSIELVRLLATPSILKFTTSRGSPLFLATQLGNLDMVRYLLNIGANPNAGQQHPSALEYAVQHENVPLARLLVRAGAQTSKMMLQAITSRDMKTARFLIDQLNASVVADSYIEHACLLGDIDMVNLLLKAGASLYSARCLLIAARANNLPLAKMLWEAGAELEEDKGRDVGLLKVNEKTLEHLSFDSTPLEVAAAMGHLDIVRLFVENNPAVHDYRYNPHYTLLMVAVHSKQYAVAKFLIEDVKMDINAQNAAGHTALMIAVLAESPELVKLLLSAGAQTEKLSSHMKLSALALAAMCENLTIAKLLVEAGAQVSPALVSEQSPLCIATGTDNLKLIQFLLDTERCSKTDLCTALLEACTKSSDDAVKKLLAAGADPLLVPPKQQDCALSEAIASNRTQIVLHMLSYKIPLDVMLPGDMSPLMRAVERNMEFEVIEAMLQQGSPVDESFKNQTVMHFAVRNGAMQVIKLLQRHMNMNLLIPHAEMLIRMAAKYTNNEGLHHFLDLFPNVQKTRETTLEILRHVARHDDEPLLIQLLEEGLEVNPVPYLASGSLSDTLQQISQQIREYLVSIEFRRRSSEFTLITYSTENMFRLLKKHIEMQKRDVTFEFLNKKMRNKFFLLDNLNDLQTATVLSVVTLRAVQPSPFLIKQQHRLYPCDTVIYLEGAKVTHADEHLLVWKKIRFADFASLLEEEESSSSSDGSFQLTIDNPFQNLLNSSSSNTTTLSTSESLSGENTNNSDKRKKLKRKLGRKPKQIHFTALLDPFALALPTPETPSNTPTTPSGDNTKDSKDSNE